MSVFSYILFNIFCGLNVELALLDIVILARVGLREHSG